MSLYTMRNRQRLGKWFLLIACLAMAICLVQRAVYLHHFLQDANQPTQTSTLSSSPSQILDESRQGPSPCQITAFSLLCAQPLFFDGAIPAIIIFLALLQRLFEGRIVVFNVVAVRPPAQRIHLKNCIFRE